jgi:hypothetical protein
MARSKSANMLMLFIAKSLFHSTHSLTTRSCKRFITTLYSSPATIELIKPLIQVISDVDDTLKSSGGTSIHIQIWFMSFS